jgi:N-methylhydantoinase A
LRHDYVNTINSPVDALDMEEVKRLVEDQMAEGRGTIESEGVAVEDLRYVHDADMQFQGQSHILTVPIPGPEVTREELRALFEKAYWERFAVELPEIRPVLVNLHTAVIGRRAHADLSALAATGANGEPKAAATRRVWFEGGWMDTPIYRRTDIGPGARINGPAIVEQMDTTIVIEPGCRAEADSYGNLIVDVLDHV